MSDTTASLKKLLHVPILPLLLATAVWNAAGSPPCRADTMVSGGSLLGSQTWTPAGSAYVIQGDVTIPAGSVLDIQAGTVVRFASGDGQGGGLDPSRVEISVHGTLSVDGSGDQGVLFEAQAAAARWYGIVTRAGSSVQIKHAIIRQARLGMHVIDSSPVVDGLTVSESDEAIHVEGTSFALLRNVVAKLNTNGIVIASTTNSAPTIANATLTHNDSHGVFSSRPVCQGVACDSREPIVLRNSIVTNNGYGVGSVGGAGGVDFDAFDISYSNLWNNTAGDVVGVKNYGGAGNIAADPQYVSAPADVHLTSISPCIDSGNPVAAPAVDIDGNPRPLDGDGMNAAEFDMGAYESPAVTGTTTTTIGSGTTSTTLPTANLVPARIAIIKPGTLAKFVAKPTTGDAFPLPAADPGTVGGALRIFDLATTAGDDTYHLPAGSAWKALGNPAAPIGYRYLGGGTPSDPCRVILVKSKVIKGVCKGSGITLMPPFTGEIGIVLSLGADSYCAQLGGDEVRNDDTLTKRKNASAPSACPSGL